jgi:hypothetical protein
MGILNKNILELLKNQTIAHAGLHSISPADCKSLSFLINNKTKQCISETTLKRIYGFALSSFQPSLFTLDALSKFCGYNGFKDFSEKNEKVTETPKHHGEEFNWEGLKQNATKITQFTLQALKNRSGIPYSQSIKRNFIDYYIDGFLQSGNTGAVIVGPPGYGKSIAICHWVEEKLEDENSDDIVLFFSSTALISVLFSGMDINNWLQGLLGYSSLFKIGALNNNNAGKFYLVIDGFDDDKIKADQFEIILEQLVDCLSVYQANEKFKVILTMRSSTWQNNQVELEGSSVKWYTNFNTGDEHTNMPLFTKNEVKELSLKINPLASKSILADVSESFKNPLYMQMYYKEYKDDFLMHNFDKTSEFEINALYFFNKVYLGKHATEKVSLIKGLVEMIDFEKFHFQLNKTDINDLIKKHQVAYKDLINAGIVEEYIEVVDYQAVSIVKFSNHYFLALSISKNLLHQYGGKFSGDLIGYINNSFACCDLKLSVLKYCIIHAIKTGQQESYESLVLIELSSTQKVNLINFLGDLLNKEFSSLKGNELLTQYFTQSFSKKMFDYFFGVELIDAEYKKTLQTLLKFELSNRKKILVYTSLAIISVINLNLEELKGYLQKLNSFNITDYQSFPVNPLLCLETLYNYLKHGIVEKSALVELTKLTFNGPEPGSDLTDCASNDMLFLLGIGTFFIADNPKKLIRFIDMVKRSYKNDDVVNTQSQYGFFIKCMTGDTYYKLGEHETVKEIYQSISNSYNAHEDLLTPFMQTLFHCLKVKTIIDTDLEDNVIGEMKCIEAIAERSGGKLNNLYTLSLLLHKGNFMEKHPSFKKQANYSYMKLVSNGGLSADTFLNQNSVNQ